MSTLADVERDAEKVAKEIRDLKAASKERAEGDEARDRRIEAIEQGMTQLKQTTDAYRRASFERSVQGTSNRELDRYTRASEDEVKQHGRSYLTPKDGVSGDRPVRLVGHERIGDPNDPQRSRYRVYGLFDDPAPRTEWQREAQRLLDRRNFVAAMLNAAREDRRPDKPRLRAYQCEAELLDHMRSGPEHIARIFSDGSAGQGGAWIPDNPMPELEREVLFQPSNWQIHQQIQMTRNPLLRPYRTGDLTAYKGQIPTLNDPPADPELTGWTTSNQVITAEEVAVGAQIHRNAEEDSIVPFEPEIRADMIRATVFAIENARINGDAAAVHQDAIASWNTRGRMDGATLGGTPDQRRLWTGLRAYAYDLTSMTTDASGAAMTTAHILADLNLLNVEHLLNSDGMVNVVIEVSPESFFGYIIDLDEFDAFDNVGLLASVLTGQLGDVSRTPGGMLPGQVGFLYGRFPVLVNYCLTKDLAATGLYTGSGATTGKLTYDRNRWQMFVRRGAMVEVEEDIRNNTRTLVSRTRMVFQPKEAASSSVKSVHWRYNTT